MICLVNPNKLRGLKFENGGYLTVSTYLSSIGSWEEIKLHFSSKGDKMLYKRLIEVNMKYSRPYKIIRDGKSTTYNSEYL